MLTCSDSINVPERILCPAIYVNFDDANEPLIICGYSAEDCYNILKRLGYSDEDCTIDDGFITSKNNFVGSIIAKNIAKDSNQLVRYSNDSELKPEDIY